jgi:hypothetical protein
MLLKDSSPRLLSLIIAAGMLVVGMWSPIEVASMGVRESLGTTFADVELVVKSEVSSLNLRGC